MRKKKTFFLLSLIAVFLTPLLLSGCGGGGGGGGGQAATTTLNLSGDVYDDTLAGATIYFYLTNPNQPFAQAETDPNGHYRAQITVDTGTETVYSKATGGKFSTTGEEFNGALYGLAPLTEATETAPGEGKTLQAHITPITSLLRFYLKKGTDVTIEEAINQLNYLLDQIGVSSETITQSSLSQLGKRHALVRRISNLLSYQVNPQDPNVSSIDQVARSIANGHLVAARLKKSWLLAKAAAANGKGELSGKVIDLDTDAAIQGAVVIVKNTSFQKQTDMEGNFFFRQLPTDTDLIIDVDAAGYASNQAVVKISSTEKNQGVIVKLKTVTSRVKVKTGEGVTAMSRARARNLEDGGIQISTPDKSVTLTFSSKALRRISRNLSSRSRHLNSPTQSSFYYVNITPVDPTQEIDAFPGDFTTDDPNAVGSDREKKLESVVLGEFSLEDENGNPVKVSELDPNGIEVRFRIPDSLQKTYKQKYDQGELFIPWYSYNRDKGLWELSDKQAKLMIMSDNKLYAVATAMHFSWWNVDWPVETHGCIEGYVREDGNAVAGVQVQATGIDYQGQSSTITDTDGYYSVTVKKDAWSRISAQIGEHKVEDPNTTYVSQQQDDGCKREDINFHLVNICGQVVDENGTGLHGAYVYSDTGLGQFTDPNGGFHLVSDPNTSIKLKVSYNRNRINHHTTKEVKVFSVNLCGDSKVIIPINLAPKYVRGTITIIENNETKTLLGREVKIAADNGATTTNRAGGSYEVPVEQGTRQVSILYRYFGSDGSYLEQSENISWVDPADANQVTDSDKNNVDIIFETQPVTLYGTVTNLADHPIIHTPVRISTTLGTYTMADPNTGKYELQVPSKTTFRAVATLAIPAARVKEADPNRITTNFSDLEVNFTLDDRVGTIKGLVLEQDSNIPLPYVSVISEYGDRTQTDPNGNFTLTVPGKETVPKVKVAFTCDGYSPEFSDCNTPPRGGQSKVTVKLGKVNHRPIIRKINIQPGLKACLNPDDAPEIDLKITALDIDPSDSLNYSVEADSPPAPQPASDPNHFTWDAPQVGTYSLTVKVWDNDPNSRATVRLPIEIVSEPRPNKKPVIVYIVPRIPLTGVPGDSKQFGVVAYDPDGDPLDYQWQVFANPNNGQGIDPNTDLSADWSLTSPNELSTALEIPQVFTTLDPNLPAAYDVQVTVSDDSGESAQKKASLIVLANRSPVIKTMRVTPGQCIIGESVKLFAKAVDREGDDITYTWSCQGATIGGSNLTDPNVTWTPPDDQAHVGTLNIKLLVTDNNTYPRSASGTMQLLVGANTAPIVTVSADKTTVLPGGQVNIQAIAKDPEQKTLTYAWSSPDGGTITGGQGTDQVAWEAPQATGDYTISVKVSDGVRETTQAITLRVTTLTVDAGENRVVKWVENLSIDPNAKVSVMPPDEPYTVQWRIDPNSIPQDANTELSDPNSLDTTFWTDTAGDYRLWLTATITASGYSKTDDVLIQVKDSIPNVSGYVKDAQGTAIAGAAVEIYDINDRQALDRQTVTNANGYYEFTNIPSGTYYVIVARDGYLQMTQTVTIP